MQLQASGSHQSAGDGALKSAGCPAESPLHSEDRQRPERVCQEQILEPQSHQNQVRDPARSHARSTRGTCGWTEGHTAPSMASTQRR